MEKTGTHLYKIQKKVGLKNNETVSDSKRREVIIARLRSGHSSLNGNLDKIRTFSGFCGICGDIETVKHILLQCKIKTEKCWKQRYNQNV